MASPVEPRVRAMRALYDRFVTKLPSGEGHTAWHQVLAEVLRITEATEALNKLRGTKDPTVTEAANQKRISLAGQKLGKEVTATMNRIFKITGDGHADIEARIRAKVKLQADPSYAAEIRDVYRRLSQTDKVKMLNELVDQNRGPEIAALIKAPISLTGMSEEFRNNYESTFITRYASDETREQKALEQAFEDALVSTKTAGEIADTLADPIKLAEITRAETLAAAAAQAFEAKVSGA